MLSRNWCKHEFVFHHSEEDSFPKTQRGGRGKEEGIWSNLTTKWIPLSESLSDIDWWH